MAPIHHHFELGGWPETTVIIRFWLLSGMCAALALGLFYADFIHLGVAGLTEHLVLGPGRHRQRCAPRPRRPRRGGGRRRRPPDPRRPRGWPRSWASSSSRRRTRPPWRRWSLGSDAVLPSPGVPDHHRLFALAAAAGVPVLSEFDLAGRWDQRPIVAITGTDGKTTVTELTRAMLEASGRRAVAVGNTEVPLVAALDDPDHRGVRGRGLVVPPPPQRPLRAQRRHVAQRGARPPRQPRQLRGLRGGQGPPVGRPGRRPGGHRQRRRPARRRPAGRCAGPPRHLRPHHERPTTTSTATGWCWPAGESWPARDELPPGLPARPGQRPGRRRQRAARRRHRGRRPRRAAGLPGPPPSRDAGGRGWRGALVRRLQGHGAARHACGRRAPSPRSC